MEHTSTPRTWHSAVELADLPEEGAGMTLELDGRRIAVFRVEGEFFACDDTCPHQGASLGCGVVVEGEIACPWHSFHFDLESGVNTDGLDLAIQTYPCRVGTGGKLEVGL